MRSPEHQLRGQHWAPEGFGAASCRREERIPNLSDHRQSEGHTELRKSIGMVESGDCPDAIKESATTSWIAVFRSWGRDFTSVTEASQLAGIRPDRTDQSWVAMSIGIAPLVHGDRPRLDFLARRNDRVVGPVGEAVSIETARFDRVEDRRDVDIAGRNGNHRLNHSHGRHGCHAGSSTAERRI